jgi:hypothetical protein
MSRPSSIIKMTLRLFPEIFDDLLRALHPLHGPLHSFIDLLLHFHLHHPRAILIPFLSLGLGQMDAFVNWKPDFELIDLCVCPLCVGC